MGVSKVSSIIPRNILNQFDSFDLGQIGRLDEYQEETRTRAHISQ